MSKKFGIQADRPDDNDEIVIELKKLRYFKLYHPRGGQYNDGYSLSANFNHLYNDDLICLLNDLGVQPVILDAYPPPEVLKDDPYYDEIEIKGATKWIHRPNTCQIRNEWFWVGFSKKGLGLTITATPGGYEVRLSDVLKAKAFEALLDKAKFDARI